MTDLITDYVNHGWSLTPIPTGSKSPGTAGWNHPASALKRAEDLPEGFGVGLMHAYSGTMALDIDDWLGTMLYGLDVAALYAEPDAVTILSGKPGRGKLLYRMPFGLVLPTKRITIDVPGGPTSGHTKKHILFELRCGTVDDKSVQDLLPPSIHPEMGTPYQWGGAGHYTKIPLVPQAVLDIWHAAIVDVRPVRVEGVDSSWEEIEGALAFINPDCSRDEWINVGMGLHWAGEQTFNNEQAFHIWDTWSQGASLRYPGEREMGKQWASFRTNKSNPVTLGTLFHLAREAGWSRPVPDASTLFGSVTPATPTDIMQLLRPAPPPPELDLFPAPLTKRAYEISEGVGCDPLVPLWAGLGAVCGVIDARTRLELMPGFKVPPVLWLMTMGEPADKKTPGSRPMLEPLAGIETEHKPKFAQEKQEWEMRNAAYSKAYKGLLDFAATPEYLLGAEAPAVPPKPDDPVSLKLTCSDITSQKLVNLAAGRPRGLLCTLDEMNSWVGKVANKMSGEDRSCWVVAYEAARYEMDRMGTGTTHAENFAVSIVGNIQPRVFYENFDNLAQDGLLQRFLPAVLRGDQTRLGNPTPDHLSSAADWERTLRVIFSMPVMTYRLSPEAYKVFRSFQGWYEKRKVSERLVQSSPTYMTAFGKIEGLVGRLALIFHAIETPFVPEVSAELLERVVALVQRYVIPVYRYLYDNNDASATTFDAWVMEHVIQHADTERVTLSDVKRHGRRALEKAGIKHRAERDQWVLNAMHTLEMMGWARRIDDGTGEHRGHAEWLINPHIETTFKDHRNAVIEAKQDIMETLRVKTGTGRRNRTHGVHELPEDDE